MVIKKSHILVVLILIIIIGGLVIFLNQREKSPTLMTSPATELPQDQNGNFILYVSNQSPAIDPVDIKILIDGEVVVEQEFHHGGGHKNWKKLQFSLSKGEYTIYAISLKGEAKLEQQFEVTDKHWAAVGYSYYPLPNQTNELTPRQLNFHMQDEPIYFK